MREINNFILSEVVQLYKKQEVTRITEDQMTLNPLSLSMPPSGNP